jgi:hypothetical protein
MMTQCSKPMARLTSRYLSAVGALLAASMALGSAPALSNESTFDSMQGREHRKPIVLQSQGNFFVGGQPKHFPFTSGVEIPGGAFAPGQVMVNQMYVHYQIPTSDGRGARPRPIIMVHGAAHSGATFESTPDGREGWSTYFLRQGHATYVVDQVARARSGFDASSTMLAKRTGDPGLIPNVAIFPKETSWVAFRFGPTFGTTYADVQFPMQAVDAYYSQLVPEFREPLITDDALNVEALAQTLDKTGPAILMTHSQSGIFGWNTALKRPKLVKGLVAVEPRTCQVKPEDLDTLSRIPVLIVFGDHVNESPNWLPIFKDCQVLAQQLRAQGGHVTLLSLPEAGLRGNTHMMMLDKNNLQVAELIRRWILKGGGHLQSR